ncbi:hypothetical protein LEP1GSC161_0733 [Leptospira santarosai str. CBC1416]|uniref:Uncharacterized protein n=2 Tax=Leptospira santarosai TaxID=28183 RepID=M6UFQ9_9LEPT|nr:hypothetical protein LEP1GSC071_0206 [Leptospira santarosai str. JET]EMF91398.1 hypothetical protein LEP1GSC005_1806 [Leptospira santarosai str. ST188]EMJ47531.1 hypothetical protein LEP1GSC169_1994 [Leptospira santarosai str. HAI1349]EMM87869.1 hypothetical protein LEP1GSC039_2771 [Leptospira santarosai str. 2000027870]EMO15409.1 hypothetical protein LEP1GSC165_0711 [Leptospira santarosai str. CBC523]EMO21721.1 hypothetical protein LEP1GSC168_1368 [Leptospira santarosai str. HAI134]EMO323
MKRMMNRTPRVCLKTLREIGSHHSIVLLKTLEFPQITSLWQFMAF